MRQVITITCILLGVASSTGAQQRGTELGLGVTGIGVNITGGDTYLLFRAGQPFVTAGLYLLPNFAVEPLASIDVRSGAGASLTFLTFGLSTPIYAAGNWGRSGLYFAPGALISIVSGQATGTGESASQVSLSIGIGTKFRVADPVSLKLGGNFAYWFENDTYLDAVNLNAQLGLSVFFH